MAGDIAAAFRERLEGDPAAPLITYYDQSTGERTELSAITADNWVSKSANYLIDELLVEPGGAVALAMPVHWQTFAIAHAAWRVGASISEAQYAGSPDVLFCGPDRMMELADADAAEIVVSSLDPMGRPVAARPDHVHDYTSEVRLHADQFTGPPPDPALIAFRSGSTELDHPHALEAAAQIAAGAQVTDGDRVLADARTIGEASLLAWTLIPIVTGGSLVLVRPDDDASAGDWVERICDQENVTRRIGDI